MIIRSFDDSESSGFDPRNYAPIGGTVITSNVAQGITQTIVDITGGEGFIDLATGYCSGSGTTSKMVITIDGTIYTFVFASNAAGGFTIDKLTSANSDSADNAGVYYRAITPISSVFLESFAAAKYGTAVAPFLYSTTDYGAKIATSSLPLFFKKSIKIEIYQGSATTSTTGCVYRGGLLV